MDGRRFDHLTRDITLSGATRRGLISALALLVRPADGLARAAAAKGRRSKKKKPKKCKPGTIKCGKTCVNPKTNALHCGGCGTRCGTGRACVNGTCRTGCPPDQILCGALCVDPRTDDQHCGGCNNPPCAGDLTCIDGQCGCASGAKCGAQCVDTQTDPDHCGGCDNPPCGNTETCVGGQCVPTGCGAGMRDCGGGRCIPDGPLACCGQADCGENPSFTDLRCQNDRCVCFQNAILGRTYGVCSRFSNGGGTCAPCCPGSDVQIGERCAGDHDERVCTAQTVDGCRCPDALPVVCSAFNQVKCSFDTNRDPRVCGRFCEECAPGGICCGGLCHYGCGQGTGGSCATGPCNPDCSPCQQGSTCCNFGGGPACYEEMGTICFPP